MGQRAFRSWIIFPASLTLDIFLDLKLDLFLGIQHDICPSWLKLDEWIALYRSWRVLVIYDTFFEKGSGLGRIRYDLPYTVLDLRLQYSNGYVSRWSFGRLMNPRRISRINHCTACTFGDFLVIALNLTLIRYTQTEC